MKYVVGVDCGGTKTEAKAYSHSGKLLGSSQSGFGNLIVDYATGLTHIQQAIDNLFELLPKEDCEEITLGIAGIDSGGLAERVQQDLASYPQPIYLINDGKIAHYSILKGQDGITVTAGTGSVILGLSKNEWYRVGGWGHLFGDEGSAYSIAKCGIQLALKEYDEGLNPSELALALFAYFQVTTVFELTKKLYTLSKGEIAGAATIIASLEASNPYVKQIINQAGKDLANSVLQIIDKMAFLKYPIQIGLNGSVIEKNKSVLNAFKATLDKEKVDYQLIKKEGSCAKGAYYLKKRNEEK